MNKKRGIFILLPAVVALLIMGSVASAAVDNVRCILWQGDTAKYHTAIDGQSIRLKGVITTTDTSTVWYKWVFGDGTESAVSALGGNTKYNVEANKTYTGAVETPFTALLMVDDVDSSMTNAVSDTYLVKIQENNLDARVNIAIDNGLWYLYKSNASNSYMHTFDGSAFMVWNYGSYYASPTASVVQAFAINNHKIYGDENEDPYVTCVKLGMNWLIQGYYLSSSYPMLQTLAIGPQPDGDPDANGNGVGIQVRDYGYRPIYEGGQIMDAIIASGVAPADDTGRAFTGSGNWTFGELMQDMCDMYSYGQYDYYSNRGGWRYSWNQAPDNSACQWAAIGMIPAQQPPWNCIVPAWVKTNNADYWLNYSHYSWNSGLWGGFGYTYYGYGWGTTPSGLVQMDFDGLVGYDDPGTPTDERDPRWIRTERYMADNWNTFLNSNNSYGWFAFAKAMRLAVPKPVERLVSNNLDWYNGSGSTKGLAARILERQSAATGEFYQNWSSRQHNTAWMIITLRPALFKAAPTACFTAHPNPNYPDQPVIFDPDCSGHSESGKDINNLTLFEWDFNDDGVYDASTGTPDDVTHSFSCATLPCTYPVTLRVTDDSDDPQTPEDESLTATFTLDIVISNPPHPPVADADGPYMVSLCAGDSLTLDGSGSYDPNEGQHEDGCGTCPDDTIISWEWDFFGAPFDYTDGSGETVVPVYTAAGVYDVGLKVTDRTELAYPNSPDLNLEDEDFTKVTVYEACACDLAARAKRGKVQLTWTHTGAASYDIYRSTQGLNTGFVLIADDHVTTYATYLDAAVVSGNTYYYRVVSSDGCGSKAVSIAVPIGR